MLSDIDTDRRGILEGVEGAEGDLPEASLSPRLCAFVNICRFPRRFWSREESLLGEAAAWKRADKFLGDPWLDLVDSKGRTCRGGVAGGRSVSALCDLWTRIASAGCCEESAGDGDAEFCFFRLLPAMPVVPLDSPPLSSVLDSASTSA